jgi:hypothetical protein
MGLLSDVYSYSDGLKRKVRGLLDDPLGTVEQFVGQLGDQTQAGISADHSAGLGLGKKPFVSVLADTRPSIGWGEPSAVTPQQREAALAQVGQNASNAGLAAATVWHGSPHKFTKFDSSKIGTGEGAQAYGHGIYTAEARDVGQEYAKAVQKPINSRAAEDALKASNPDLLKRLHEATGNDIYSGSAGQAFMRPNDFNLPPELKKEIVSFKKNSSYLYKVDLPDQHIAKMLDWDKPLSQQHPDVRSLLDAASPMPAKGWSSSSDGNVQTFLAQLAKATGDSGKASAYLKQAGIPGIRYLDGGSRGTGAGTSNFVVFPGNEGLLTILERNGQPIK